MMEANPISTRVFFALVASVPPFLVADATQNLDLLVSITGSYGGCMLVFVFPAVFVTCARNIVREKMMGALTGGVSRTEGGDDLDFKHKHSSPFSSRAWVYLMFVWAATLLTFETITLVQRAIGTGQSPSPSPNATSASTAAWI